MSACTGVVDWNNDGGTAEVGGDAWIVSPTIEVELPADLSFGINPMKLDVDVDEENTVNTQIITEDYPITNYSDVPVAVLTQTYVSLPDDTDIELLSKAPSYDTKTNEMINSDGKRSVVLIQEFPIKDATVDEESGEVTNYGFPDTDWTAKITTSYKYGEFLQDGEESKNTVYFLLDKYSDALKPANTVAFRFGGQVNPTTQFEEGEISVTSIFTLNIITEAQKSYYSLGSTNGGATGLVTTVAKKTK